MIVWVEPAGLPSLHWSRIMLRSVAADQAVAVDQNPTLLE